MFSYSKWAQLTHNESIKKNTYPKKSALCTKKN